MSKANERERAEMSKDATKEALRLAREALKTCDNKQARALLLRVIDDLTVARKAITLPPKPRAPKAKPVKYTGGGSWCTTMTRRQPGFSRESW